MRRRVGCNAPGMLRRARASGERGVPCRAEGSRAGRAERSRNHARVRGWKRPATWRSAPHLRVLSRARRQVWRLNGRAGSCDAAEVCCVAFAGSTRHKKGCHGRRGGGTCKVGTSPRPTGRARWPTCASCSRSLLADLFAAYSRRIASTSTASWSTCSPSTWARGTQTPRGTSGPSTFTATRSRRTSATRA